MDIEAFNEGTTTHFVGAYLQGDDDHTIIGFTDWEVFKRRNVELRLRGLRLVDLETYKDANGINYLGIYRTGDYLQVINTATDWDTFGADWIASNNRGWSLVNVEAVYQDNTPTYIGVYNDVGPADQVLGLMATHESFVMFCEANNALGFRITDVHVVF